MKSGISVIMPTYRQAAFIERAINSLLLQTYTSWELLIINDGSDDDTETIVKKFFNDSRILYFRNEFNEGLGATLNKGIGIAKYERIAYLPSDDIIYKDHLSILYKTLDNNKNAILACSGIKFNISQFNGRTYGETTIGVIPNSTFQLAQILHYKTDQKWLERNELVTDDLNVMFWKELLEDFEPCYTNEITCEWVDHPIQRHRIINEFFGGGIYLYKRYYNVTKPLYFRSSLGNLEDEITYYSSFNSEQQFDFEYPKGLKILIVGDLSYNPERIYALENRGHKLYGLWTREISNHTTIGPLPFGNVTDINYDEWESQIREIEPDIIYALSNHHSISIAHEVLMKCKDIPFVWHLKEGPFHARIGGKWEQLVDLINLSDGRVFHNTLTKEWYNQFLTFDSEDCFVLDGELPKIEWFSNERSELLSNIDNEMHTVFAGRPVGLTLEDLIEITSYKIHLHFYGDIFQTAYGTSLIFPAIEVAPDYIHLHPNCTPMNWVAEFSKYDAGWLHYFKSENQGELIRSDWSDLNSPARIATYAMAGIPMIQYDNSGSLVSTQELAHDLDIGIFIKSFNELSLVFEEKQRRLKLRENMWENRFEFCYDMHLDDLLSFFHNIIDKKNH